MPDVKSDQLVNIRFLVIHKMLATRVIIPLMKSVLGIGPFLNSGKGTRENCRCSALPKIMSYVEIF